MNTRKQVDLSDVIGLDEQKNKFYKSFILPIKEKELYEELILKPEKINPRKNFLLYGPPATGKTLLVQALAHEYKIPIKFAQSTQFIKPVVGTGAESLRELYKGFEGTIFIDEIDLIAKKRTFSNHDYVNDICTQLLLILDGAFGNYKCSTIVATNNYDQLDEAFLSRFPKSHQIYFPPLDFEQRKKIFQKHLSYFKTNIQDVTPLINLTENYEGRNIEDFIFDAFENAVFKKQKYITQKNFEEVLK